MLGIEQPAGQLTEVVSKINKPAPPLARASY